MYEYVALAQAGSFSVCAKWCDFFNRLLDAFGLTAAQNHAHSGVVVVAH